MSYTRYGISQELVERIKLKMKNPQMKEKVKKALNAVTKKDLQDRAKVKRLLTKLSAILGESISPKQAEGIVAFVIDQKIDPSNTFHLIRLWTMFR